MARGNVRGKRFLEMWSVLKLAKCATEVCGFRRVEQEITKGSERWNGNLTSAVLHKRKVIEQWLQHRS